MRYTTITFYDGGQPRGAFDQCEAAGTYYCVTRSITGAEYYRAQAAGIDVSMTVNMAAADYPGLTICTVDGKWYKVTRTYELDNNTIDLTLTAGGGAA